MGNACCATDDMEIQNDRVENVGSVSKKSKNPGKMGAPRTQTKKPKSKSRKELLSKKKPILLGYWKIRGLAHPIRYLLEYCEHPYEDVMYEQGDAPNYSVECWTSVKNTLGLDFPSIPYMIDQETKLTDVYAIMLYLATAYAPELLGVDPDEKGEIDMMYSQLKDVKSAITGPCYVG